MGNHLIHMMLLMVKSVKLELNTFSSLFLICSVPGFLVIYATVKKYPK